MKKKLMLMVIFISLAFYGCNIKTREETNYIKDNYKFVGLYVDQCGVGGCLLGGVYYYEGVFEDIPIKRIDYKKYDIPNKKELIESYKKEVK